MDLLTFVAKIIEALAWPLAGVVLVALLRKEIRILVPFIKKLKAGPLEAEFERTAAELAAALPAQPKALEARAENVGSVRAELVINEDNPRLEVLETWLRLEAAAQEAITRQTVQSGPPGSMSTRPSGCGLAETLKRRGLLHEGQVDLFRKLQHLRNEVVHTLDFTPTHEAIVEYIDAASYLTWWLTKIAK